MTWRSWKPPSPRPKPIGVEHGHTTAQTNGHRNCPIAVAGLAESSVRQALYCQTLSLDSGAVIGLDREQASGPGRFESAAPVAVHGFAADLPEHRNYAGQDLQDLLPLL